MPKQPIAASYRRFLLDMHVPDWHESFLQEFDPERFLDLVAAAGVKTVTLPSNGHHGLAFWPTDVGARHGARSATEFLPRLLDGAAARDLNRIVYYCTTYVEWFWATHPDARIVDSTGQSRRVSMPGWPYPRRFAICCLNSPEYRAFVRGQLDELSSRYQFEGVNLDMMFWPTVCYCGSCVARYADECGGDLPRIVDWTDPEWTAFAAARRRWLLEFVEEAAHVVHANKPHAVVTHQSQMYTQEWIFGGSVELSRATAWLTSDLYRGPTELSFDFKLFYGLSENLPFEQISSWSWPDVHEHVLTRTEHELAALAGLAVMNDAAIVFLDQPDPTGSVTEHLYPVIGRINERVASLEADLGGSPRRDVAIYVSFEAGFDDELGATSVDEFGYSLELGGRLSGPNAHRHAARSAGSAFMAHHIPFSVITRKQLSKLSSWQAVVLPNVTVLDDDEIDAFTAYVARGGGLYASGRTSLLGAAGSKRTDFGLAAVLGVSHVGQFDDVQTFISPRRDGLVSFPSATPKRPMTLHSRQQITTAHPDAEVVATITRAWTDPEGDAYASIIANPPGRPTDLPSVVRHRFGQGRATYSAGMLESGRHPAQRASFVDLVRGLCVRPLSFESDAPSCVEIMLYDQQEVSCLVVHLLNVQSVVPPIPIERINLRIRLDGTRALRLVELPTHEPVRWAQAGDSLNVEVPTLTTHLVLKIEYATH